MEREDLLKKIKEIQEPNLAHLAMLNSAFLQTMDMIDRVRELHVPQERYTFRGGRHYLMCQHCTNYFYPCPTIQALEGEK